MQKAGLLLFISIMSFFQGDSQLYMTRNGFIGFYSKTALEDIVAENNQVYAVVDPSKKNLAFSLLMKGFIFRKELMQSHFNENYVESDKYPKANFTGSFTGELNPEKNGTYPVTVKGNLTIHNVTRPIEKPGRFEIADGKLTGYADFTVKPEDFDIKIPSIVRDKISELITVHVKVSCNIVK
jgi:YceI-like protein